MLIATTRTTVWKHFQARFAEWFNAGILTFWGCYVILHPGMMADPRVVALWQGLTNMAPQETWGMVALVVGLARSMALYVNGAHKRTPLIRLVACFLSAFILTQITLGLFHGNGPNTGLVIYPALILADIYSAFRASADMTFVARQDLETEHSEPGRVVSIAQRNKSA